MTRYMVESLRVFGRDRTGVSLVEFALALPLLAGFMLGGLEMANFALATSTCQRLATMTADMMAQSGVGGQATSESQIYDIFDAIDVSAKPYDMRNRGRIVLSVVKGVQQPDGTVRNEFADAIFSQQFDGSYVTATPLIGCRSTGALPSLSRALPNGEIMVHSQITYNYKPLFVPSNLSYFLPPTEITRTAAFRMRKNSYSIAGDVAYPPKSNCATATGL